MWGEERFVYDLISFLKTFVIGDIDKILPDKELLLLECYYKSKS